MINKDQLKQALTVDDVTKIVCHLGSDAPRIDNKGNLIFQTICHNFVGGSYKLYYYDNSKLFSCYTECQKTFDIYELVEKVKKVSFTEAVFFIQQFTGFAPFESKIQSDERISDWEFINRYRKPPSSNIELNTFDPVVLNIYQKKYHVSWIEEGISKKAMERFGILFDSFNNRIIIPHYDINNTLVGIRCRNLNQEVIDKGMKYVPVKIEGTVYSHPLSYNLYGIKENLNTIKNLRRAIIFEGEKSVLKMETFYPGHNFSVAVCGDKVSEYQRKLITKYVDEVIIAFDKSEPYKHGGKNESIIRVRDIAKRFCSYVKTFIIVDKNNLLPIKDAPVDQGKDIFDQLIKSKVEVRTFLNTF